MKYSKLIKAQTILEVLPQAEQLEEEFNTDEYHDEEHQKTMDEMQLHLDNFEEHIEKELPEDGDVTPADPAIALLQTALAGEYQQWDLYTTYASRLKGFSRDPISEEFKAHAAEELDHIDLLQRYIVSMGHAPTVMRKSVPDLPSNATIKDIVDLQLHFEREAVDQYKKMLDLVEENASLRVDIENILVKEQEHVHDLEMILESPVHARVLAQVFRPMEAGEEVKPSAGYGCCEGCGGILPAKPQGGYCACEKCKCKLDEVTKQWCSKAFKELTPDLYARWEQGHLLSTQEKNFLANMSAMKWGAKDSRAMMRFLDMPKI